MPLALSLSLVPFLAIKSDMLSSLSALHTDAFRAVTHKEHVPCTLCHLSVDGTRNMKIKDISIAPYRHDIVVAPIVQPSYRLAIGEREP